MELAGNIVPSAWMAAEGLIAHENARRRRRLGLCDPICCNRFLLWGLAGVVWLVLEIVVLVQEIEFALNGRWSDATAAIPPGRSPRETVDGSASRRVRVPDVRADRSLRNAREHRHDGLVLRHSGERALDTDDRLEQGRGIPQINEPAAIPLNEVDHEPGRDPIDQQRRPLRASIFDLWSKPSAMPISRLLEARELALQQFWHRLPNSIAIQLVAQPEYDEPVGDGEIR